MPDIVETALARTLSEAADAAQEPPGDLLHRVDTGFRRRRHRRYSVVAGVAALAVILGSTVWANDVFSPHSDPAPAVEPAPPAPLPAPVPGKPKPIAQEWPEAYHTIPAKLPDGRKITPQQMINDREVLVTTDASFGNADELWIIDVHTDQARLLTRLPAPHPDRETFALHFTIGSGHVVWLDSYRSNVKEHTRIWKARLSYGKPVLVGTVSEGFGGVADRLVVHRDRVYLSGSLSGDVWQLPLAGGKARVVPGTETYQIVSWPWVGRPGRCDQWPPRKEGCSNTPATLRMFTELLNAETGVRREVQVPDPDLQGFICSLNYCFASSRTDRSKHVIFTRDGRLMRVLPGSPGLDHLPLRGRFVLLGKQKKQDTEGLLYDIKTGRYADLEIRREPDGSISPPMSWNSGSRLYFWPIDDRRSYAIIDVGAIE